MSWIDKKFRDIKESKVGKTNRRVLLVEGVDDEHPLTVWLEQYNSDWKEQWVITNAGKKSHVLELLEREPTWIGVVDRDEWSEGDILQKQKQYSNLFVLPRFCIENYLCDPLEVWGLLPPIQQRKIQDGSSGFLKLVTDETPKWLQHGALWHVINPLWEGLRDLGFKERLLSIDISGQDDLIRQTLTSWHGFLEPNAIWDKYQMRLAEVQNWSPTQQWQLGVHGKLFYPQVIHAILNGLLGQCEANKRQTELCKNLILPEDLNPLWTLMDLKKSSSI